MEIVDLRSDTVTRPTPAMRQAMAAAEVGDDVFGEDPTARRLELAAAERVGTEDALFVPTGTMGNQVALHVLCRPGREVVLEARSHILNYERGAMAVWSGLLPRVVCTPDGLMTAAQVREALRPDDVVHAATGLVALENTHNMAGGRVLPLERTREIQEVAHSRGIPVHLDGARLFNAATALGLTARELASGFDSVMFCLSKGLGAPAGSVLCGSGPFVREARKVRKTFGGAMRQVGVLAAAGLVGLETRVERLGEDHRAARDLAAGLAKLEGLELTSPPETNILIVRVLSSWAPRTAEHGTAAAFVANLREHGVLALSVGPDLVRFVTHGDLPPDAVSRAVSAASRTP